MSLNKYRKKLYSFLHMLVFNFKYECASVKVILYSVLVIMPIIFSLIRLQSQEILL